LACFSAFAGNGNKCFTGIEYFGLLFFLLFIARGFFIMVSSLVEMASGFGLGDDFFD